MNVFNCWWPKCYFELIVLGQVQATGVQILLSERARRVFNQQNILDLRISHLLVRLPKLYEVYWCVGIYLAMLDILGY